MPSGNTYPFATVSVGTTATFLDVSPAKRRRRPARQSRPGSGLSFGDIYAVTAEGSAYVTWVGI